MLVVDETGAEVQAEVALRDAVPAGTAFLERGIAAEGANALRGERVTVVPIPVAVRLELVLEEEALA